MVDKVKALNWRLYSKIFVVLANISVIYLIIQIALNTKSMANELIIFLYALIGVLTYFLMKLSDAAIIDLNR